MSKTKIQEKKKRGRPRKVKTELVSLRQDIDKTKTSFLNRLPVRKLTEVQQKAQDDFIEIISLFSSGHFDLNKACDIQGRHIDWLRNYLTNNPLQKSLLETAKEKSRENSLAQAIINAQDGYNKLIGGYELKKTKQVFSHAENNSAITFLDQTIVEKQEVGPNTELILLTLKKLTPRFSELNPISIRQTLFEFFTFERHYIIIHRKFN